MSVVTRMRHPRGHGTVRVPDSPADLEKYPRATDLPTTVKPSADAGDRTTGRVAEWLAVLRVATGFVFLWAFLDKLFGFGFATPSESSWINGGSPTEGFLSRVDVGPFASTFNDIAGDAWADWLFMVGLAGIGIAVMLGIGLRAAAVSGTVLMALMWMAEWPPAKHTSAGEPTMSTNPVIDYHIIYALVLIVLAVMAAGDRWGFGRMWARLPFVQRHRSLLK